MGRLLLSGRRQRERVLLMLSSSLSSASISSTLTELTLPTRCAAQRLPPADMAKSVELISPPDSL